MTMKKGENQIREEKQEQHNQQQLCIHPHHLLLALVRTMKNSQKHWCRMFQCRWGAQVVSTVQFWHSFCSFFYSQVYFNHIGLSSEEMVGVQLNTIKGEGKPSDNDKIPNHTPSLTFILPCVHAQSIWLSLICHFLDWIQLDTQEKCAEERNERDIDSFHRS